MRTMKYVVLTLALLAVVPLAGMQTGTPQATQPGAVDPEIQKLADDYAAAWAKGDAAGIAALYTTDAIYIDSQGKMMSGRSEIEATFKQRFAGDLKGTTIKLTVGTSRKLAPELQLGEGTWQIVGVAPGATSTTTAAPTTQPTGTSGTRTVGGRYLNTIAREQGRWMIAGTAAVPQATGPVS